MEEIKVIVVTYKDYDMPNDSMYYPILVGDNKSELRHKYATDDTGGIIFQIKMQHILSLQRFIGHGKILIVNM